MWKETIKPLLGEILTSKKALALIAGVIVWLLAQAKVAASPDQIIPLLGLIAAYIFGQGVADNGKSRAKIETATVKELADKELKPAPDPS